MGFNAFGVGEPCEFKWLMGLFIVVVIAAAAAEEPGDHALNGTEDSVSFTMALLIGHARENPSSEHA